MLDSAHPLSSMALSEQVTGGRAVPPDNRGIRHTGTSKLALFCVAKVSFDDSLAPRDHGVRRDSVIRDGRRGRSVAEPCTHCGNGVQRCVQHRPT